MSKRVHKLTLALHMLAKEETCALRKSFFRVTVVCVPLMPPQQLRYQHFPPLAYNQATTTTHSRPMCPSHFLSGWHFWAPPAVGPDLSEPDQGFRRFWTKICPESEPGLPPIIPGPVMMYELLTCRLCRCGSNMADDCFPKSINI